MVSMGRDLVIYVLCFVSGGEVRSSFGDGDSYFSNLSYWLLKTKFLEKISFIKKKKKQQMNFTWCYIMLLLLYNFAG